MNWSCFRYSNDLQSVVQSMLEEEPHERPAAKFILQTKLLNDRMEHIQSSFDYPLESFVELDPNFFPLFRSEGTEN